MTVLHAWALWLLPLALLPFLLNRRTPPAGPRLVSALHLWPVTPPPSERAPRPALIRVDRRRGLLAVLVALIVVALAEPQWRARTADLVLIVETSADMGARAGAMTRLARGRDDALAALASGDAAARAILRVHVLTAGAQVSDLGLFTSGSASLRGALAAITPGAAAPHIDQALDAAAASEPGVPVWTVSSHDVPGAVRSFVPGPAGPNLAITALTAEGPAGGEMTVTTQVENMSDEPATARLALIVSGETPVDEPVALDAGAVRTLTHVLRGSTAVVEARLTTTGTDALALDNVRLAVVAREPAVRVQLAGDAGPFVAAAIAAHPLLRVVDGDADVLVCRRCPSSSPYVSGVLELPPANAPVQTPARVRVTGPAHAVSAGLAGLTASASAVRAGAQGAVLVRAGDEPLVTVEESDRGRTVHLAGDVTAPAFGQSPFFAVLLANAVDWLAARENPTTVEAGAPLRWWVGSASSASLSGPDGRERPSRREHGWLTSTATDDPGLYNVRTPHGTAPLAVTPAPITPAGAGRRDDPHAVADAAAPGRSVTSPTRTAFALSRWLLALALLLAVVEWRLWPGMPAAAWPRALAIGGLLLGCAGLSLPAGRAPLHVVFAVDRSDSVSPRAQQAALAFAATASRRMETGDTAGLVTFGERPLVRRAGAPAPLTLEAGVEPGSAGSNIAGAIDAALPLLPRDGTGRIVLMTDGRETTGTAVDAAASAAARRVALDVLPAGSRAALPLVRSVSAPADVHGDEPFAVDVLASGPAGGRAAITLTGGDAPLTAEGTFDADGTALVRFSARRTQPGVAVFRASTGDEPESTAPGAAVTVLGPARLLIVTAPHQGAPVRLTAAGYAIDRLPAAALPVAETGLAAYQVVVLDRVPGEAITDASASALSDWVAHGGGLVVLGDAASLPSGGYARPRIDAMLPADLRVAPSARTPATATVVALDKSGSMADTVGGLQKLEAARDAVRRVARALAPADTLGVIAFDMRATGIVEPGPASRGAVIDAALTALVPGGATRLAPAVELAAEWLRRSGATRRHLLVVSDGRTSGDDLSRAGTLAGEAGLTLSVIAVGADADRAGLTATATRTGGRAYFPDQLADLPRLAAGDVVQSRGGATVTTPVPLRAASAHPVLTGLPLDALPLVGGYVVAATRPGADAILESSLSDPVLVTGRAGLGRVALVTTDLGGTWSDALRRWSGYPALEAQTLRWVSRHDVATGIEVSVEDAPAGGTVNVRVDEGASLSAPRAHLLTPDGRVLPLTLRPASARLFRGMLPDIGPGLSRVEVVTGADGNEVRVTRGLLRQADRERAATGVDDTLLTTLASMTGGRRLTEQAAPFTLPRPLGYRPARPIPELLALVSILALAAGGFRRGTGTASHASGTAA